MAEYLYRMTKCLHRMTEYLHRTAESFCRMTEYLYRMAECFCIMTDNLLIKLQDFFVYIWCAPSHIFRSIV
jgi:hypothetical protein